MRLTKGVCSVCGGSLIGDGYQDLRTCENVDRFSDPRCDGLAPDEGPVYCEVLELRLQEQGLLHGY